MPVPALAAFPTNTLLFASITHPKLYTPAPNYPSTTSSSSSSHNLLSFRHHSSSSAHVTRVTAAPVEYAPPAPDSHLGLEVARLTALKSTLSGKPSLEDRIRVIDDDPKVKDFFHSNSAVFSRIAASLSLTKYELYLLKCVVAAGQGHVITSGIFEAEFASPRGSLKSALYALVDIIDKWDENGMGDVGFGRKLHILPLERKDVVALQDLLKTLANVDKFYNCIGGIIGYQVMVLKLLSQSSFDKLSEHWSQNVNETMQRKIMEIYPPTGLDLSQNKEYAFEAALWGVEGLPDLGEIYPLGGSADRLGLVDHDTGECLPAAMLPYCGRTLLEGLIRDLQAREFLYYKLYGKQCVTPVAIMTSSAKKNHKRITALCEKLQWFGRGKSNFRLFEQPLVPAVTAEDGQWIVTKPFAPLCKPGGHGVIWKLAYDNGVFHWFYNHGRKGITIRQVSNVVAATDVTLLALAGIGMRHGKKLGFASCRRNLGATEGINVLVERKNFDGKWAYGLSCIEYTEFEKFGINEGPLYLNSAQSEFPANTNILYVDLHAAELVGSRNDESSLPGMVLNVKKPIVYTDQFGIRHSVPGGRLECTMQNIADNFLNTYSSRCFKGVEDELDTFVVYNERKRVTSSAKKKRKGTDKSLHQTPEGSLLDIMRNAYDLLTQSGVKIPKIESNIKYADSGPPYLIFLHPALGPLWDVTKQKFHGGSISNGSELQVEVSEFLWSDVQLNGSLIIVAENVMGSTKIDEHGETILQYGHRCGRCKLQSVKVQNKGIDWTNEDNIYWKHDVQRVEELRIILHGNAEFEAANVTLQGSHVFEVPNGYKLKITQGNQGIVSQLHPIDNKMMDMGSWFWRYRIKGKNIELELVDLLK
uniref:UGP3-like C-terminal hexapeptide repeats domain-containing protein n=1 Tax=Kalanchoe fedtschenkoi TaxID=63787 RepID=A0A7N0RJU5_KALFE